MTPFPIVDTHLHLWDPTRIRYPWLAQAPMLNKPYVLEDYDKACAPVQVEKMVFVQCECDFSMFLEEARWVSELAAQDTRLAGIIPWAPLEKGDAALEALEQLAQDSLVKGIRRIIEFEPDIEFCLQPDFVRGVQLCADFKFHFEININHRQMANTIKMVRQCPNVRFVLDHCGKPNVKDQLLEPWKTHIKTLAAMPNVSCKLSGLTVEADREKWTLKDLQPFIDHILDAFGFDRTMYGGDWPVMLQATQYPRWVETVQQAVNGCSPNELERLFRTNAIDFYRLRK